MDRTDTASPTQDRLRLLLATLSVDYSAGVRGRNIAVHSLALSLQQDLELDARLHIEIVEQGLREPPDALLPRWRAARPQLLGLSCYAWNTPLLLHLAEQLAEELPELHIVLGGPDAAPRAETLLRRHPRVDAVALGEGEESLRALLRRLVGLDPGDWRSAPGLLVRVGEQLVRTPEPPEVDLDGLPSLLDAPDLVATQGALTLQGARGCRYRCAYCQYNNLPRRERSLAALTAELERYAAQGGGLVHLLDAGANQSPDRLKALLGVIAARPELALSGVEINLEALTDEEIGLLAQSSAELAVGLQTTTPAALRAIRRAYRPEAFRARAEALRREGVPFSLDLIYGLPEDDYAGFVQSLSDAYSLRPRLVRPHHLQVLPGSTLARERQRWALDYDPEPPYLVRSTRTFSPGDLQRAHALCAANDLMHGWSMDSTPFQELARDLEIDPARWLEQFVAGGWRGGTEVQLHELQRWSDPQHLESLAVALRQWLEASYQAAERSPAPAELLDPWDLQLDYARLRFGPPLRAPTSAAPWSSTGGATLKLVLSPAAVLRRLPSPLLDDDDATEGQPAEYAFEVLSPEPDGEVRETLLPEVLGELLAEADGRRDLETLLTMAGARHASPSEQPELRVALLEVLADLWTLGLVVEVAG